MGTKEILTVGKLIEMLSEIDKDTLVLVKGRDGQMTPANQIDVLRVFTEKMRYSFVSNGLEDLFPNSQAICLHRLFRFDDTPVIDMYDLGEY